MQETGRGICQITFLNNNEKITYKLEKSGEVYLNAKPGTLHLRQIMCFTGMFSESNYFFDQDLNKAELVQGKSNYVGDVVLSWKLGSAKMNWGQFLLSPGNPIHRYGDIEVVVSKTKETLSHFLKTHPKATDQEVIENPWVFL